MVLPILPPASPSRRLRVPSALLALAAAPIAVGQAPAPPTGNMRLNDAVIQIALGSIVSDYETSPDGKWAVYIAEQDGEEAFELYSRRTIDSGKSIKLNHELAFDGDVVLFRISPDGTKVAYKAFEGSYGLGLHIVPIHGSGEPIRLADTTNSTDLWFHPEGHTILYVSYGSHFYQVPADGSAQPVLVNDPGVTPMALHGFAPDGDLIAYSAGCCGVQHVYVSRFSVPATSVDLTPILSAGDVLTAHPVLTSDGTRVIFRAVIGGGRPQVYHVPTDASELPMPLNGPLGADREVMDFVVSSDGSRVVYRSDEELNGKYQLYVVPSDGSAVPQRVSAPLPGTGDVFEYAITPDGASVVYRADQDTNGVDELYAVPIDRIFRRRSS